jgi:hypothetical protein
MIPASFRSSRTKALRCRSVGTCAAGATAALVQPLSKVATSMKIQKSALLN